MGPLGLTTANITGTTATLNIANYTGNWHYRADAGPDSACQGPVSGASKDLTGLTAGATYTYKAYSDSSCSNANLLATAVEFTASYTSGQVSVSNLNESFAADLIIGALQQNANNEQRTSASTRPDRDLGTIVGHTRIRTIRPTRRPTPAGQSGTL